jgi:signal transduction histidine kinase
MLSRTDDTSVVRRGRPFQRAGLIRRTALFPVALALAFALYPFAGARYGATFFAAAALAAVSVPLILLTPWDRLPQLMQIVPPLLFVATVMLLREAHSGASSGYAAFSFVPVIWLALYGAAWQLGTVVVAVGLGLALPIVIEGGPHYPPAEWQRVVGVLFISATLAWTIRSLVGRLVEQSAARVEAERRVRELEAYELHDDVVQSLTAAQLALSLERAEEAEAAVAHALHTTQRIVASALGAPHARFETGQLARSAKPSEGDGDRT